MNIRAIILALPVLLALALAWRSEQRIDQLDVRLAPHRMLTADSYFGAVVLSIHVGNDQMPPGRIHRVTSTPDLASAVDGSLRGWADRRWGVAGIEYLHLVNRSTGASTASAHAVRLPYWLIALLLSLPLLRHIYRRRRRAMRRAEGLCVACGYDLRHTPDRCPECGTATVPSLG